MTPLTYLTTFAGDASTRGLYQDLLTNGETQSSLDQGSTSISYTGARRTALRGDGDRRLSSSELFERVVGSGSHAAAYRRFAGEALPWVTSGSASATVLQSFDASVAAWRRDNNLPTGTNRALAEHVYNWLTTSSGLNLHIVENEAERNVDEVLSSHRGDCTESTKTLLNLLSRVGFSPYPVWVHVNSEGNRIDHIATGLDIGGRTYLLDPVFGNFNQPHRQYTRLSLREFLAWHWNNRALDLKVSAPSNARTLYDRALQIDPNNPYILLNRGILRRDRLSDAAGGASDFQAAVAADSNFHPAQYELGNMAYDARRYSEAAGFFRQAVAGDTQSARYRRNLILALIQLGSTREARPHFRALCRLDAGASDLPRLAVVLGVPLPAAARV